MKTRDDRSPDTKRADALAFRKAIDHFGSGRELVALSPEDVAGFMAALRKTVSQGAANVYFRHLRAAFNVAVEWDLIKKNPFAKVRLPRVEKEIPRLVTAEVRERILEAIKDPDFRRMIQVYLITGLRRKELVNLKWKDVLPEGIRIKGKRGKYRILPPAPAILDLIGPGGEPDEYVFPRWRDPNVITRMFRKAANDAGYPETTLHHCRHTAASALAMMGYGPETVRELLGHTTTAMTLHYQHVTRTHLLEAMRRLGKPTTIEIEPEEPAGVPALAAAK
jgi:integrase